jgi:hypothetical protein
MVAMGPRFLDADPAELLSDLEATIRVLRGLKAAHADNPQQAATIAQQIQACQRHLEIQRANLEAAT